MTESNGLMMRVRRLIGTTPCTCYNPGDSELALECERCELLALTLAADEPSVLGGGCGVPPMPTVTDAIEAHIRQIEQLCDAANVDPSQWLIGAEPPRDGFTDALAQELYGKDPAAVGCAMMHADDIEGDSTEALALRVLAEEVRRLRASQPPRAPECATSCWLKDSYDAIDAGGSPLPSRPERCP